MLDLFAHIIRNSLTRKVTATGLGILRILYGLVLFQEILFLIYFNHLIFDPIPFMDVEFPMITFFLGLWSVCALCIVFGYRYQLATLVNYILWIVFVCFTPMQRDFDGGFDQFMTGVAFLLIFLPADRSFSIDNLRRKLALSDLNTFYHPSKTVSILTYTVPVILCLGFLYFDSAIHKLSADHWRNGLGAWLPSTQPYYISAIDMSWLLNQEWLQKTIGYTIIIFQFIFLFLYFSRLFRPIALFLGIALHLGITFTLNIYPFGLGMLALYPLVVPFSWWKCIASKLVNKQPVLSVYFDEECPLCNRTVITIQHFDIFKTILFKGLQTYASNQPALKNLDSKDLLTDLYAIDSTGRLYSGLDTYIQILAKMRYTLLLSYLLIIPGIYHISSRCYRYIADNRTRTAPCTTECALPFKNTTVADTIYTRYIENLANIKPVALSIRLAKIFIFILLLQINSTFHYAFIYRMGLTPEKNPLTAPLATLSNSILSLSTTFLGITPHALYLHDHFKGYNHLIGIAYLDASNKEHWLPFINTEGRIIAPNWGRVHSMWANIAVTPNIDHYRLNKFIMKITAFWGIKSGLDLNKTVFIIKMKRNLAPPIWIYDLRNANINQPWINIGTAKWHDKFIDIQLSDGINEL